MTFQELETTLLQLTPDEKRHIIQLLTDSLQEPDPPTPPTEEDTLLQQLATTEATVWSPYDSYGAAQTLSESLQDTKTNTTPAEPLTHFFQNSPLATAIDDLDLSRDRSLPPNRISL